MQKNMKWVVLIHDLDGVHKRNHSSLEGAVKYMNNTLGRNIDPREVQNHLNTKNSFRRGDDWGRTVEIVYGLVGSCKVCKKRNELLGGVVIPPEGERLDRKYRVKVCLDCLNDYECGGWTVEYDEKGKQSIKKQR